MNTRSVQLGVEAEVVDLVLAGDPPTQEGEPLGHRGVEPRLRRVGVRELVVRGADLHRLGHGRRRRPRPAACAGAGSTDRSRRPGAQRATRPCGRRRRRRWGSRVASGTAGRLLPQSRGRAAPRTTWTCRARARGCAPRARRGAWAARGRGRGRARTPRTRRAWCTSARSRTSSRMRGGVEPAAVGQEADLLGREVGQPRAAEPAAHQADQRRRHRDHGLAREPQRLGQHEDAVAGDVEGAPVRRRSSRARIASRPSSSCTNCSRASCPSTIGTTGSAEVRRHRGVDLGADEVREAQGRHRDVGAAAGEAAHVRLDLDRVLRPARARLAAAARCPR